MAASPARLYRLDEIPETNVGWMIKDWWPYPSYGMLGGAKKSLKSWLLTATAFSVASRRPLFGELEVKESGPVVVFTGEGSADLFRRRLRHVGRLDRVRRRHR